MHPDAASIFRESNVVEFLILPDGHSGADLYADPLRPLKDLMVGLGRDLSMSAPSIRCRSADGISRGIFCSSIAASTAGSPSN